VEQLIASFQYTIPGFIYVCIFYFSLMLSVHKYDFTFPDHIIKYFPFIGLLIVFASLAVGYSAHLIGEYFIACLYHSYSFSPAGLFRVQKDEIAYHGLSNAYQNFIMLRHLVISTFFLTIFLAFWIWKGVHRRRCILTIIYGFILTAIFVFAYCIQRNFIIVLKHSLHLQ
jgi:uncharacterized membrane protein